MNKYLPVVFFIGLILFVGWAISGLYKIYGAAPNPEFFTRQIETTGEVVVIVTNELDDKHSVTVNVQKGSVFNFDINSQSVGLVEGGQLVTIQSVPGMCFVAEVTASITKTSEFWGSTVIKKPKLRTISVLVCDPQIAGENQNIIDVPFPIFKVGCGGVSVTNKNTTAAIFATVVVDEVTSYPIVVEGEATENQVWSYTDYNSHSATINWNTVGYEEFSGTEETVLFGPCNAPTATPYPTIPVTPSTTDVTPTP